MQRYDSFETGEAESTFGRSSDHSMSKRRKSRSRTSANEPAAELSSFKSTISKGLSNEAFVPDSRGSSQHRTPHDTILVTEQPTKEEERPPKDEKAKWRRHINLALKCLAFVLFHTYLAAGVVLTWDRAPDYCQGVKLLSVVTVVVYVYLLCSIASTGYDRFLKTKVDNACSRAAKSLPGPIYRHKRIFVWAACWGAVLAFLIYDTRADFRRLISVGGALVLLFIGFVFSKHRKNINWYQIMWGMMLQFVLGLIVLRWEVGRSTFACIGDKVKTFLDFTKAGSHFVFGYLASGFSLNNALRELLESKAANLTDAAVNTTDVATNATVAALPSIMDIPPVFLCLALPVVFFFSFFVSILYFYGIMQWMVLRVGTFLQYTLGTTVCESMTAAGNIFLGMTEAPLVVSPFFPVMTKSELHTVMTGGFATIAGSVMAAYIGFGVSASHLLTASIMSAPAALAFAKLVYPEVEESKTNITNIEMPKSQENNLLEAASNGTAVGLLIIGSIVANLIGFLAFLAFLNSLLTWLGEIVLLDFISFEWLLACMFTPLAFLMGVPWKDCGVVGELVGIKTFANEFLAYAQLAQVKDRLDERSVVISTYALCGFSNLGSIGICLGALGALCPERKGDFADVAVRALFAGSCACFITACIAGSLIP